MLYMSIEQRCEEEQMATYCICYGEFPLFGVCYTSATLPHTLSFLCHQLRIICCHTCIVIPCLCHIFPGSVNYSTKHTYCVLIEVYVVLLFCPFLNNFKIKTQCDNVAKKTFVESSSKESHHLERFSLKCFKSAISDFFLRIFQIKYLT